MNPEGRAGSEACKIPIFSSSGPADGSATARVISDAVRKCTHDRAAAGVSADPDGEAQIAEGELAVLSRLLAAAEGLINKASLESALDAVLVEAVSAIEADGDTVDESEQEIDRLEARLRTEGTRALAAAASVGRADPWPPAGGAQELLDAAGAALAEAVSTIDRSEGSDGYERLVAERDRLDAEIVRLSNVLEKCR